MPKHRTGDKKIFTGINSPYERPLLKIKLQLILRNWNVDGNEFDSKILSGYNYPVVYSCAFNVSLSLIFEITL